MTFFRLWAHKEAILKVGQIVRDKITGFQGVAIARTEWLNGCVRIMVQPREMREGKPIETQTFDVEQLELVAGAEEVSFVRLPTGGDRPNVTRAPDPR